MGELSSPGLKPFTSSYETSIRGYTEAKMFIIFCKTTEKNRRQEFALCTKLLVGVVSLSVFGGNFVLAKVRLGLISVRCSELRGLRFSKVQNVLVLW